MVWGSRLSAWCIGARWVTRAADVANAPVHARARERSLDGGRLKLAGVALCAQGEYGGGGGCAVGSQQQGSQPSTAPPGPITFPPERT
eukprot:COSAG01_NODE_2131_length_8361_cov_7.018276_3_plen_88_part_00